MKAYKHEVVMKDETRIALLEQSVGHINETMLRIEKRFDSIDKRFDTLESDMKQGFARLDGKVDSNFRWLIGTIVTLFVLNGLVPVLGHFIQKFTN